MMNNGIDKGIIIRFDRHQWAGNIGSICKDIIYFFKTKDISYVYFQHGGI